MSIIQTMDDDVVNRAFKNIQEFSDVLGLFRAKLGEDVLDIKTRLKHLEENSAVANRRLDRMDERLIRIEKRLNLVDA